MFALSVSHFKPYIPLTLTPNASEGPKKAQKLTCPNALQNKGFVPILRARKTGIRNFAGFLTTGQMNALYQA